MMTLLFLTIHTTQLPKISDVPRPAKHGKIPINPTLSPDVVNKQEVQGSRKRPRSESVPGEASNKKKNPQNKTEPPKVSFVSSAEYI
jgi:hypothetical protein